MEKFLSATKEFILDILFPKFCLVCSREGKYLCEDCFYLIDILDSQYCAFCWPPKIVLDGKTCRFCRRKKNLTGLFFAADYNNALVKNLIHQFKYEPYYLKKLSKPLANLIIAHFLKLKPFTIAGKNSSSPDLIAKNKDFIIIPVPLHKKKLKKRGYNQAEEIGKELSKTLNIPIFNNILIKTRKTLSQTELNKKQRKKNIIGAFSIQNPELILNKKILLVDDVFTTGTTMEESSRLLKLNGAKEIWGIVIARG